MNMTKEEYDIENKFSYHKPFGNQNTRYESLRSTAKVLALDIIKLCPDSRERERAIEKLEEVVMLANASIARNEKEIKEEEQDKFDVNAVEGGKQEISEPIEEKKAEDINQQAT
jgi:hypothetical protein